MQNTLHKSLEVRRITVKNLRLSRVPLCGEGRGIEPIMLRASNSLDDREGHKVFSAVTGGRPSFFSRRISGGSRSPEPVEGNAEGARLPR